MCENGEITYRVGVDIGGTKINIGLFDNGGKLLRNKKILISETNDISKSLHSVVKELADITKTDYGKISFCGVGIPGTVSEDGKEVLKAPNLTILPKNAAEEFEKELKMPVRLLQDSRAAAWGEYLYGGGKGKKTVVCITLGTGIGCGIVMNNAVFCGALGGAGEIGHITAVPNGRVCGCGRLGCTEKYAAGLGLEMTARELLGKDKKCEDLFDEAKSGNPDAKKAIDNAVEMLGRAVVSVVNLISPDCILFSGGLSTQRELYVKPLIEYIETHCYSAGKLPEIKTAALGENSPLYGAAYIPFKANKRKSFVSASIMCADVLNMGEELKKIEQSGIEYLHCDIMDNHFVPNLMLPPEMLNKFRKASNLPFDFHIMAENPEKIIEELTICRGDIISVHYEATQHIQRVVALIKEKGALASVAINPATPLWVLEEILPQVDAVLLMTVSPGFAGQKIVPGAFEKIGRARELADKMGLERLIIEVDGNCSFENVPKMHKAGANMFVAGTSSVFNKDVSLDEGVERLKKSIAEI